MTKTILDPALYRRMCEPLASMDAAEDAINAFFDDLRALREKHHIRDLVCTTQIAYIDGGDEIVAASHQTIGSKAEAVGMAAVLYGALRKDWEQAMDMATHRRKGEA